MGELVEGLIAALGIVAGLLITLTSLWWETPPTTQGQHEPRSICPEESRMAA